jgi:type I restriction enzyme, S subunit
MVIRKGYQQTEFGIIPEDWHIKKISEFTDATSGGTPSRFIKEYWNGDIRWMNSGELNLKKVFDVEGRITELGLKKSATKLIPKNCILIGLAGQGKTRGTVAMNYVELCINQSIGAILPNESFDPEYLYYNLDSRYKELRKISTGGEGRGGLNLTLIRNISIPLPPTVKEQLIIKKILQDLDHLLNSLDSLIQKKKNIKQGAMQELLTGKRRLEGFSGEWKTVTFGDISKIKRGASPRPIDDPKYFGQGRGWIRISDVSKSFKYLEKTEDYLSKLGESKSVIVDKGDVIMSIAATVGRPIIVKMEACIHDGFIVFSKLTNDINPEFLYYVLKYYEPKLSKTGQQGTQSNVNSKLVSEMKFLKPSMNEQDVISKIFSDMDLEIQELENQLEKYTNLKQAMMQKLLTGEIRLV